MSGFSGFSDAYIQKLHKGDEPVKEHFNTGEGQRQMLKSKKKLTAMENKNLKILENKTNIKDINIDVPLNAKLNFEENDTKKQSVDLHNLKDSKDDNLNQMRNPQTDESNHNVTNSKFPEKTVISEKKSMNLDDFQLRRKRMEEQNRQRKQLLTKALEDRTKQTLAEQQRLNKIQKDFKKLDESLSNDVKILRKQIEFASLDYMEAQKKYYRAEKEFLDAKIWLHKRLERKEMLTEHLCEIIEKNEERKADKLNELLEKLDCKDVSNMNQDSNDNNGLAPD